MSDAQNPKFTQDEWIAHARKHRWRFDLPHDESGNGGKALSASTGLTVAEHIRRAIDQYLRKQK